MNTSLFDVLVLRGVSDKPNYVCGGCHEFLLPSWIRQYFEMRIVSKILLIISDIFFLLSRQDVYMIC